jgi:putative PIN family toxin of toxin-antitoxin system
MKENKTVFDVNIWLSYFISGKAEQIIDMIEINAVRFYRSEGLMSELKDVINRPKFTKYFSNGTDDYISFVEQVAELVRTQSVFNRCLDPYDNYLFDLAYQSHSDFLVSGDKKVLAVSVEPPLKSLSLSAFKIAVEESTVSK